jgi:hypothetical protein
MPVLPDISEAAIKALQQRMIDNLALLNARLTQDATTPVPTIIAAQIVRGDPDSLPPSALFPVWFALVGGDAGDGTELAPFQSTFGDSHPYENPYFATITAYVHKDTVFDKDPFVNERIRHDVLSRLSGWLRADVLNTSDALLITLKSQEYSSGTTFDQLKAGAIRRTRRADAMKGAGRNIAVPCIRHDFEAVIK